MDTIYPDFAIAGSCLLDLVRETNSGRDADKLGAESLCLFDRLGGDVLVCPARPSIPASAAMAAFRFLVFGKAIDVSGTGAEVAAVVLLAL